MSLKKIESLKLAELFDQMSEKMNLPKDVG